MRGRNIDGPALSASGFFCLTSFCLKVDCITAKASPDQLEGRKMEGKNINGPGSISLPNIFASHLFALKSVASRQGFTEPVRRQKDGRQKY
jgi:hypothetical protein